MTTLLAAVPAAIFLFASFPAWAQGVAQPVRVLPSTTRAELRALPDSQILVFPNGLRMNAGQLRGLAPSQRSARPGSEVLRKPGPGPVVPVTPSSSLVELERLPPNTLLQVPDGRRITAAQLKEVDEALARSKSAPARAAPGAGQVVRVPRGTPVAELLARPDSDILESPGGKRVTVGELRRYMSSRGTSATPKARP